MAVPTIQITGSVVSPDGAVLTSGVIVAELSQPGSALDGAVSVRVLGKISATITAGTVAADLDLVPNDAITPAGTYYRVTIFGTTADGQVYRSAVPEKWQVASSPASVDIGAVTRLDVVPGVALGLPNATATAAGAVTLANDLGGTAALPTVVATHLSAPLPEAQGGSGAASLSSGLVTATGSTTARTLAARFSDVLNVRDFGATGDGSTNDTSALQALFDVAAGRRIYFPKGTYRARDLRPPNNAIIFGEGKDSIIKAPDGVTAPLPVIYAVSRSGLRISDLSIDGNRANIGVGATRDMGQPWEGIDLSECSNIEIRRVWIQNCDNEGIDCDGGDDIVIDGVTISGCGGAGIHPSNGSGALTALGVRIRNLTSSSNGATYSRPAIYIYDSQGVIVDGVRSTGDYGAVHVDVTSARDVRAIIRGVEALTCTGHAVRIGDGARQVDIDGLEAITAGGSGLYVEGTTTDRGSRWTRVRVIDPAAGGVRIAGTNWVLTDAVVSNAVGASIATLSADGLIVRPRLVGGAGSTRGIQIGGARTTVIAPDISGHTAEGIYTDNVADVQVVGGRSTGGTYGYYMNNSAGSLRHRLVGFSVQGNGTAGLRAVGSGHTFSGCPGAGDSLGDIGADRGDAAATLVAGTDAEIQRWSTELTQNRAITLSTAAGTVKGARFRVVRTGLGAFTLAVGSLKTIPNSTAAFVDVMFDGSAWVLTGYGTL